jgi:hypothetical protein
VLRSPDRTVQKYPHTIMGQHKLQGIRKIKAKAYKFRDCIFTLLQKHPHKKIVPVQNTESKKNKIKLNRISPIGSHNTANPPHNLRGYARETPLASLPNRLA